ncbi:MAG: TonB-dependent receptor [Ignavibacteria bacterium]|jgi:iron complex outermembrane receptor protein
MKKGISFLMVVQFLLFVCGVKAQQNSKDSLWIRTFELGEVLITDSAEENPADEITSHDLEAFQKESISSALDLLPGVSLSAVGARNEAMVYIRGYDLRQVPVFIDGMPVYVPYDGYIDLARLQTSNVSKISVSKGFSSMLYGANSMGGAINIITGKPAANLEANIQTAVSLSGEGKNSYKTALNFGSRMESWYFQGNFSSIDRDFVSLPSSFSPVDNEVDNKRDNSYAKDIQYQIKAGFQPKEGHEYSAGYSGVRSEKGVPVYLGNNPNTKVRYWQYPDWDKDCIYFHSKTTISKNYILKTRLFYDKYYNVLKSFDDNTYTTQTKKSAFTSIYDDKSYGGAVELSIYSIKDNELKFAVNSKYDHHKEYNEGETPVNFKDNNLMLAIEDVWNVAPKITLIGGAGYCARYGIKAEEYSSSDDLISEFDTPNDNAFNFQAGLYYRLKERHSVYATAARKSRFATMKDRYSYKMGKALPNPDLESEHSVNTEIGYNGSTESIQWSVAGFYNFISNTIQEVNDVEPGIYQLQNTGEAEFRGFELNAGWKFNPIFAMGASYSYIDQENVSNPELKFVDIPQNKLTAYIKAEKINQFYAMLNVIYHSNSYSTSDGLYKTPSFTVVNLNAEYFVLANISVKAGIHNIFDELYYYDEGFPAEGRTFNFSLAYGLSR